MILYSLILIITMLFKPMGLLGRKEFQISKVLKKLFPSLREDGVKKNA